MEVAADEVYTQNKCKVRFHTTCMDTFHTTIPTCQQVAVNNNASIATCMLACSVYHQPPQLSQPLLPTIGRFHAMITCIRFLWEEKEFCFSTLYV